MHIFDNPYIFITVLVIGVGLLAAAGVFFALRGLKAAREQNNKAFASISKIERYFNKLGNLSSRSVLYINLSADNLRVSSSETNLFLEIKDRLLDTFANDNASFIAPYDENNYIVIANFGVETFEDLAEPCINDINKLLLKHNSFNIVNIIMGAFDSSRIQVSFDDAINRAKQACMLAKSKKITFAEWNASSGKALEKKIKIEKSIEKEIDDNHFFLEYQPVLDAKTRKIIGAEVLSRLNSESDGVLSPKNFLSAVDSVGINNKFDYYIFEKNCKWISNDKQQREGYKYTINFSRSTTSEPGFVEKITGIAEKYNLKYSCLAVEILEDKNITGAAKQQMISNLSMLKEKGISILLDDFGSGYTTFGDLQNFDISIIKIDKSITHNSVTEKGFKILKNIIQTAKDIGFKTLCEGIETKEQEDVVIEAGCDFLQGFYYYRPMPVSKLETLLDNSQEGE